VQLQERKASDSTETSDKKQRTDFGSKEANSFFHQLMQYFHSHQIVDQSQIQRFNTQEGLGMLWAAVFRDVEHCPSLPSNLDSKVLAWSLETTSADIFANAEVVVSH